jgi:N-sulfoglucosamine sulfohydrolase
MINTMWPGGLQPVTQAPVIKPAGGNWKKERKIKLSCATRGASIVYTTVTGPKPHWRLYHKPIALPNPATLRAKAIRYGFKESTESIAVFA